jgi:hypothetical protein
MEIEIEVVIKLTHCSTDIFLTGITPSDNVNPGDRVTVFGSKAKIERERERRGESGE